MKIIITVRDENGAEIQRLQSWVLVAPKPQPSETGKGETNDDN